LCTATDRTFFAFSWPITYSSRIRLIPGGFRSLKEGGSKRWERRLCPATVWQRPTHSVQIHRVVTAWQPSHRYAAGLSMRSTISALDFPQNEQSSFFEERSPLLLHNTVGLRLGLNSSSTDPFV